MTSRPSVLLTRRWPDAAEQTLATRYDRTTNPEDRTMPRQALAVALQAFDIVCPTITDRINATMIGSGQLRTQALCKTIGCVGSRPRTRLHTHFPLKA